MRKMIPVLSQNNYKLNSQNVQAPSVLIQHHYCSLRNCPLFGGFKKDREETEKTIRVTEYFAKVTLHNKHLSLCVCFSVESWGMAEEETEDGDWPELLSDVSVVGGAGHGAGMPRLKRGQGSRHLGVDMTFNPEEEEGTDQHNKYFTSSGNTVGSLLNQLYRSGV